MIGAASHAVRALSRKNCIVKADNYNVANVLVLRVLSMLYLGSSGEHYVSVFSFIAGADGARYTFHAQV